jgi:hypothetical protein
MGDEQNTVHCHTISSGDYDSGLSIVDIGKIQFPSDVDYISRLCLSCLGPLVFLFPKTFKLFGFPIFSLSIFY